MSAFANGRPAVPTKALHGRRVAIVIGCADVGSAIACALHKGGYAVVLTDHVDPPWARRGMGYADAWFLGTAELASVTACFCASVRTVATLLSQRLIAATAWSWSGIAEALGPEVVVDARMRADRAPALLTGTPAVTVGVGPGFLPGVHVDVVVDGDPVPDGDSRLAVRADAPGRFMTSCRIGERVRRGQVVGHVGRQALLAPGDGVLRGVSARGARIHPGVTVIEVDPRGDPEACFGLDPRQRRIGDDVVAALAARHVHGPGAAHGASARRRAVTLAQ